MSEILAKILVYITGVFGLVAILYIFGSALISTGSSIANEGITISGWLLLFFGTLVLLLILLLKRR